jgi:hypothetical protein
VVLPAASARRPSDLSAAPAAAAAAAGRRRRLDEGDVDHLVLFFLDRIRRHDRCNQEHESPCVQGQRERLPGDAAPAESCFGVVINTRHGGLGSAEAVVSPDRRTGPGKGRDYNHGQLSSFQPPHRIFPARYSSITNRFAPWGWQFGY